MILAQVELHNYKHYVGEHLIEVPAQGIVGVIGTNGAGKTTIFEAIEWCLYKPATISNAEVPSRGGTGKTIVRVTLEDQRQACRYVVERTLRRETATAEIYREDRPESPIVQGSRDVTRYVSRSLIGLSHRAFVSTFFTRQKELSFFGTLGDTDRRREVGRLLGFETICTAQEAIAKDRNHAKADAESLRRQYEDATANRDFAAELALAETTIAAREIAASEATARAAAATTAYTAARQSLNTHQALEREDAAFNTALARIAGNQYAARIQLASAEDALHRLAESERTRASLAPIAGQEEARRQAVAAHLAERDRAARLRQLESDRRRAEQSHAEASGAARDLVTRTREVATELPAWNWNGDDETDPIGAIERRIGAVEALDVEAVCHQAESLAQCRHLIDERDKANATFEHGARFLHGLEATRAALVVDGHPNDAIRNADADRMAALQTAESAAARLDHAQRERQRLAPIVASLTTQRFDDKCPTCGRSFSEHESATVLQTLSTRIDELTSLERNLQTEQQRAKRDAAAAEQRKQAATRLLQEVATLDGRIADGFTKVEDAKQDAERTAQEVADALLSLGVAVEPSVETVTAAKQRVEIVTRAVRAVDLLRKLKQDAERAAGEIVAVSRAIAEHGSVAYDAKAHQVAEQELEQSHTARARIAQVDKELAQRPDRESERDTARLDLTRLESERAEQAAARIALGFDRTALETALATEQAALEQDRAATKHQNEARTMLREAIAARDALVTEQTRVADLGRRSETRRREADTFDQMVREFSRFDRYVANRVTPQLAEHTGELLREVTDGRFDKVTFDDNYGLSIFDGDEAFPIAEFSGGERDVAALSARLALSRLVGGQAAHPPEFLVLDEVFGSLDQDRRSHVLDMLGALANSTDAFRQLFIISHVEDTRLSPIFEELWRITDVHGVSQFENLTRDMGIEDV